MTDCPVHSPRPGDFFLTATDDCARAGLLHTAHGPVETPIFMHSSMEASISGVVTSPTPI